MRRTRASVAAEAKNLDSKAKTVVTPQAPANDTKKKGSWAIGDKVPDLTLRNQRDEPVSLHSLVKDRGIIVFLYPKANTPGCTKQACGFRDEHAKITKAGYAVYGLSADSPKAQSSWKSKYSLPYDLLCDPAFVFIKGMGASKAPKGIKRSHIVIGKGGVIEDLQIQVSPLDSVELAVQKVV